MGNITPNLQMKTLTFTEVNSAEVTDSKRKSQTRNLQSRLQSLCSKLRPGGHTKGFMEVLGVLAQPVCRALRVACEGPPVLA